jgi:hypothetical protein
VVDGDGSPVVFAADGEVHGDQRDAVVLRVRTAYSIASWCGGMVWPKAARVVMSSGLGRARRFSAR